MINTLALLAIEIDIDPEIREFGELLLTWHGVFTAVGIAGGVYVAVLLARRLGFIDDDVYSVALIAIPAGIIGARALWVVERWGDPGIDSAMDILRVNEGGISVFGAIIGGVIGGLIYGWIRKFPIRRALDIAGCATLVGMAIGRIGDLINGEHFAEASSLPWAVKYVNDNNPSFASHPQCSVDPLLFSFGDTSSICAQHPAVAYELLGDLLIVGLILGVMFLLRKDGVAFFGAILLYSVMRLGLSELRIDSKEIIWGLTTPQVTALFLIPVGVLGLVYTLRQPRRELPEEPRAAPNAEAPA
ncbi:MAG: prolipoprotein diacylglyceryl transferase [Chloroflexi bacterium]|nr:prolipoprotein diacylglyceryl transferase [Chloroflexota bacterium]MCI0776825.1 prolipoprotein diacylglyceryl transferase [Chloroflexota bacterium]